MNRDHRRTPFTRPLVLLFQGHETTRALYALSLSAMGFDVMAVGDRAEAYGRASRAHPDIIVADVAAQEQDGWNLLRDLKADSRTRAIPVLIITADGPPVVRQRIEREGGAACLVKPCLPDRLAVELRHVLARSA